MGVDAALVAGIWGGGGIGDDDRQDFRGFGGIGVESGGLVGTRAARAACRARSACNRTLSGVFPFGPRDFGSSPSSIPSIACSCHWLSWLQVTPNCLHSSAPELRSVHNASTDRHFSAAVYRRREALRP